MCPLTPCRRAWLGAEARRRHAGALEPGLHGVAELGGGVVHAGNHTDVKYRSSDDP